MELMNDIFLLTYLLLLLLLLLLLSFQLSLQALILEVHVPLQIHV